MDSLFAKWRSLELTSTSDIEGFIGWFQAYKAPVVRSSMLRPVREECGLGSPPIPFTTNASETANYMLKHKVNYQRSELPEFLQKLRGLALDQEREVEKSVIGRGKYELRSQYLSFHVPETKWFTMTTLQREQHLKRFAGASLSDVSQGEDAGESGSNSASICLGRDTSLSSSLSVPISTFANAVRVPRNCLEGIWNKAAELLKTNDAIVPAPGVGADAKFVLSYRGNKPHLVIPKKGGSFACDSDCPNWKALGICAHSVAVAELCKKLSVFIESFKKAKKAPSLTKFAQATMPRGRGRQGSVCPRKRKASTATETRVLNPSLAEHPTQANLSQCGQGLQPLTVSQSNSVQLPPSQATLQLSNSSIVQHSWPYSSLPPISPQMPPGPAWPPGSVAM